MSTQLINNSIVKCHLNSLNRKVTRNVQQQNFKFNARKRYLNIQPKRFHHKVHAANIESKGLASQNLSSILNDEVIISLVINVIIIH